MLRDQPRAFVMPPCQRLSSLSNPKTPLPADEIGKVFGAEPEIGPDGVVDYYIPRKVELILGGI